MSPPPPPDPALGPLLATLAARRASDLHLVAGAPPHLRVDGRLAPLADAPVAAETIAALAAAAMTPEQRARFAERRQLDVAFEVAGLGRFRCNASVQRGAVSLAVRLIPSEIPSLAELGLPPIAASLARRPRGLVLVTGPAGAGKSTTLAALVDLIARERPAHIITLEDPIEFVHPHRRGLVNQREIGADAPSWADALRNALRQDPDVLLVGELRDADSLAAALTIAETGHLTLGSLHTNSAAQTIHRVLDVFPAAQQPRIRSQLALSLEAVLCQQLVPRAGGGRVPAVEVLVATPAVRTLIREDRVHQIPAAIQAGRRFGMQTLAQALSDLVRRGLVSRQDAQRYASRHEDLEPLLADAPPPPVYAAD